MKSPLLACLMGAALTWTLPSAQAQTLRWASAGDPLTLDP